jgi:hypothetical protein
VLEKIGAVKNPLTIVAIFAAITEVSASVVLPLLTSKNQNTYLWFLILFPTGLVSVFFYALINHYEKLYAPSDFKNEENFMLLFHKGTPKEIQNKIGIEIKNIKFQSIEEGLDNKRQDGISYQTITAETIKSSSIVGSATAASDKNKNLVNYSISRSIAAKRLVLDYIGGIYGDRPVEQIKLGPKEKDGYLFDGIIVAAFQTLFIEAKYLPRLSNAINIADETIPKIVSDINKYAVRDDVEIDIKIIMCFVTEEINFDAATIIMELDLRFNQMGVPIIFKIYNLDMLQDMLSRSA